MVVFAAIMLGWPLPLVPLQILSLNLVTDVFPAMALALEPSAPGVMKQSPRDPRQALMLRHFVGLIVAQTVLRRSRSPRWSWRSSPCAPWLRSRWSRS